MKLGDIWMILKDPKMLAKLMVIQGVGQRELARAAGWKAHSYLGRLLKGAVKTVEPEPAARIAAYLGVGVDDLFLVKVDSPAVQNGQTDKIHSRGQGKICA
jgi:transcriptional regulator with XRE-family HTH domain